MGMGKFSLKGLALGRSGWSTVCLAAVFGTLGLACGAAANAQTPQPLFPVTTPISLSATSDASAEFLGDFNGDGVPDLAYLLIANNQYSLNIQLSIGSDTSTPVSTTLCPSTGSSPQFAFADVNNDKRLDVVFSCNGYLTIQFGNGDGSFQSPTYIPNISVGPLVDLNGDGYLDIVGYPTGSSASPGTLAVLINQGAGAPGVFSSPTLYADPNNSSGVTAGDFNGDGKQDLLYTFTPAYSASTTVSILYGNGDGTLNPVKSLTPGNFSSFTTGDFNRDGITDVALLLTPVGTNLTTSVQILLGATNGAFTQGVTIPITSTTGAGAPLAAVDLTGDGNLDLVVPTSVLNIFRGDGTGNFAPTGSYAFSGSPLLFGDVNGDGKQDIVLGTLNSVTVLPGNGDGTFQTLPGTPVYGPIADLNNDGIADMVFLGPSAGNALPVTFFGTAIGRGDGTFSILNQTTSLPPLSTAPGVYGFTLMTGDFNGDGKVDTLAIQGGGNNGVCAEAPLSQLASYLGSGDGKFQAKGTLLSLGVTGAVQGITGDFNSDGNLDIILPYSGLCGSGLVFVPGNGDGTFAAPINLNATQTTQTPSLLSGDLNNDKKLDFVWGDAVFLGYGDGTFRQIPLSLPSNNGQIGASAFADLNGDGILDAVSAPGVSLYAGNGDGTFQSTAFYSVSFPMYTYAGPLAIGDVNGDGNPDLLVAESAIQSSSLVVYEGDGHGNFTQDATTYLLGLQTGVLANTTARLNNQAPALSSDGKLDLLVEISNGSVDGDTFTESLLNQTNPAPTKPVPLTSSTELQASPAAANPGASITLTASVSGTNPTGSVVFSANGASLSTEELVNGAASLQTSFANTGNYAVTAAYQGDSQNTASTSAATTVAITPAASATTLQATPAAGDLNQQITLKATVSGDNPSGKVTFAAGSTSLGTSTVASGVATLQTSFATAGSYNVTATYAGDQNNAGSTSSAVAITIAAPDFTIAASPTSASITPGQASTFTFTVSPVAGYSGTVKFSCGTLPSLAACSFSPATVSPSGGSPLSSTLTVTTAAATTAVLRERPFDPSRLPWIPSGALAMAGVIGLAFAPKKMGRWHRHLRLLSFGLLLCSVSLLTILGCGGGGSGNTSPSSPGTPAGSYTVSVTAGDSAGGPQHAVNITLTVQ